MIAPVLVIIAFSCDLKMMRPLREPPTIRVLVRKRILKKRKENVTCIISSS